MHDKIKVNIARIKLYVHVPLIKNVSAVSNRRNVRYTYIYKYIGTIKVYVYIF